MKQVMLLDCTLRDGGYVNDWEFGQDVMLNILERLVSTGVELIEVGFLDQSRPYDVHRSIFPDTASVEQSFGKVNKRASRFVAMIDYGTCDISRLQPREQSCLDCIRVIFKKEKMREAIAFCAQVKALGYQVFTQAVSITSYSQQDLLELIALVNELQPFALSMVDTYGLLHQDNASHVFRVFDQQLLPQIAIGYHAHNNFQMGYANCIQILGADTDRTILVDGTLYGMGKSAGNAPLELLAMYMNENFGKQYDICQMLEAIETTILEIQRKARWGYDLFYYVAAANRCHPNYVSYLLEKRTLSIKSVNDILKRIPEEQKLAYSQKAIEGLYLQYQKTECDDMAALAQLKAELSGRRVVLLGPGKSLPGNTDAVAEYIRRTGSVVIPINDLLSGLRSDYLFLTNSKRYLQLSSTLAEPQYRDLPIIATSNVTNASAAPFRFVLNYSALIDESTEIPDNSLVMLLKVCRMLGVERVALAGFDGYSEDEIAYYKTEKEYSFSRSKARYLNSYVKEFLKTLEGVLPVEFITPSVYVS